MANPDLRDWITQLAEANDICAVSGANCEQEIGGIVDIYQRKMGRPALLFDMIRGYRPNYRVVANNLTSVPRIAMTLGLPAGAYANRYTVVVDDDIDPANMDEVITAMCTRVNRREDVEILRGNWSTALDPMNYPDNLRALNSRMVIDACRPWARRDTFPRVARSSKETDARIMAKWKHVLPVSTDHEAE